MCGWVSAASSAPKVAAAAALVFSFYFSVWLLLFFTCSNQAANKKLGCLSYLQGNLKPGFFIITICIFQFLLFRSISLSLLSCCVSSADVPQSTATLYSFSNAGYSFCSVFTTVRPIRHALVTDSIHYQLGLFTLSLIESFIFFLPYPLAWHFRRVHWTPFIYFILSFLFFPLPFRRMTLIMVSSFDGRGSSSMRGKFENVQSIQQDDSVDRIRWENSQKTDRARFTGWRESTRHVTNRSNYCVSRITRTTTTTVPPCYPVSTRYSAAHV